MPTIGRVVHGGPMIRIREDGESLDAAEMRLEKLALTARISGDTDLAESFATAAEFARDRQGSKK